MSAHPEVNKSHKKVRRKQIIVNWINHAIITLSCWQHTPNREALQTNDTSIWIVTNIFLLAKLFQLPPSTICVNPEISKAVVALAFESAQSISTTIMPAPKIMNHAVLYFIETVGMHCKLAIRYWSIWTPYTTINYFFHRPPFHL